MQILNSAIFLFEIFDTFIITVFRRCCSHFIQPRLCLSVCLWEKCRQLSSPPLSQHVGLCVCEDSSCFLRSRSRGKHLPLSPPLFLLQLLLPSSNINGCWFFNEEVGVPVQRPWRGRWCTGAKHIPRLWSSNTSLARWDREEEGDEGVG